MKTRKQFLAAASASALIAATPGPKATPKPKYSAAAHALAEQMRAFDPRLSDSEIDTIAQGMDGQLKLGAQVNPKGRALRNSDEPATVFEVGV